MHIQIAPALATLTLLLALNAHAETPKEPTATYTVQAGDKLIVLADRLLTNPQSWSEVVQYNRITHANRIRVGQKIQIPLRLMRWAPSEARLISANGDIQINGKPAEVGAGIAEGDQLKAGARSSAVIELKEGTRVQLMPQSLAELVKHRQYGEEDASGKVHWFAGLLRLTKGAVEAFVTPGVQRATPLQVNTPTSVVGVRGTHFRVAFDEQARSEVMEGLVVAENPAQLAKADLPAGTGAVIRPEAKEIQVRQLLPAPKLGSAPAQFQANQVWGWPSAEGAKAWRVQLAADAAFTRIVFEEKLASPALPMAALPLGQWFARVRAIDSVGLEGFDASRPLGIVPAVVPDWTLSESRLVLSNGITSLQWTPVELRDQKGGEWRATVMREGEAVHATSIQLAGGTFAELADLAPGNYTVAIDGSDAQGVAFKRKNFSLAIPEAWGASVTGLANPLQLSP